MAGMINDRLVLFPESSTLITGAPSGFRKNKKHICTMDHLVRFETYVRYIFLNGEHVVSTFFDFEKANDTTWKYGIMKDLYDMDLGEHLPLFVQNL